MEAPNEVLTKTLSSPNDELRVTQKGIYEILDVNACFTVICIWLTPDIQITDSQCPGSVIADDATYSVDHVPRPSAKLSSTVKSTYESYNGSHILPPICEGVHSHVDLELTGMYLFRCSDHLTGNSFRSPAFPNYVQYR